MMARSQNSGTARLPRLSAPALALPLAIAASAATAQTAPADDREQPAALDVSGSVWLVSDYRFRGVSLSDLGPAIQPQLQLTATNGLFLSFWGSSIADFNGATTEIDLSIGWSGTVAGLDTTVGVYGYLYPGGSNTDIVEFYGTLGLPLGPLIATVGLNWAPDQPNLPSSSRYAYATLSAAIPNRPVTLKASVGHERGGLVTDESGRTTTKWDWMLGADLSIAQITLGLAYVGSDLPRPDLGGFRANRLAQDGLVLSLAAAF